MSRIPRLSRIPRGRELADFPDELTMARRIGWVHRDASGEIQLFCLIHRIRQHFVHHILLAEAIAIRAEIGSAEEEGRAVVDVLTPDRNALRIGCGRWNIEQCLDCRR